MERFFKVFFSIKTVTDIVNLGAEQFLDPVRRKAGIIILWEGLSRLQNTFLNWIHDDLHDEHRDLIFFSTFYHLRIKIHQINLYLSWSHFNKNKDLLCRPQLYQENCYLELPSWAFSAWPHSTGWSNKILSLVKWRRRYSKYDFHLGDQTEILWFKFGAINCSIDHRRKGSCHIYSLYQITCYPTEAPTVLAYHQHRCGIQFLSYVKSVIE